MPDDDLEPGQYKVNVPQHGEVRITIYRDGGATVLRRGGHAEDYPAGSRLAAEAMAIVKLRGVKTS